MFLPVSGILILLKKDRLQLYFGKNSKELVYPPNLVQNLEVLDVPGFEKSISQFLTQIGLKKEKVLVVLSDEIVFQKTIPVISGEQMEKMIQDFLSSIPFNAQKVSFKKIASESELIIFSVNKDFYRSVQTVLENMGFTLSAVVPISVFKERLTIEDEVLNPSLVGKILSKKDLIKAADFLSDAQGQIKPSVFHKSFPLIYLLIFGVLLISAVSFWGAVSFGYIDNPLNFFSKDKKADKNIASQKPAEATPTASEKESTASTKEATESSKLKKEDITIQILNGSGIEGQASALKEQLESLGFTNIETGNAGGTPAKETTVIFTSKVSSDILDQILAELEETFESVSSQEETEVAEFDIIITTGSYK